MPLELIQKAKQKITNIFRTQPDEPVPIENPALKLSEAFTSFGNSVNPTEAAQIFNISIDKLVKPFQHSVFFGDRMLTIDKASAFMEDETFSKAFRAVLGDYQYDQYGGNHTIAWRLHTLVWAAKNAASIRGDFVELGVFKGHMAQVVCDCVDLKAMDKKFYLYDSFCGYSPTTSCPSDFPGNPNFFEFANRVYREPGIFESVCERFSDRPFVKITKGYIPESLEKDPPEHIAFLHVDLNSAKAEVSALEFLFDRVSPGGFVVFDDYGWKQFYKQRIAHDEFMNSRGYSVLELPTGQGLVVKR